MARRRRQEEAQRVALYKLQKEQERAQKEKLERMKREAERVTGAPTPKQLRALYDRDLEGVKNKRQQLEARERRRKEATAKRIALARAK